jgi:hypothetical protein
LPKKSQKGLGGLFVLPFECARMESVAKYLNAVPLAVCEQELTNWASRHRELARQMANLLADGYLAKHGLACEQSFREPALLPDRFWVVSSAYSILGIHLLRVEFDPTSNERIVAALRESEPFRWNGGCFLFGPQLWICVKKDIGLPEEQLSWAFKDAVISERRRIERIRGRALASTTETNGSRRPTIPTELKELVWHRDGGRCVNCGSTVELQFDHIIPHCRGGGSTAQNLQLMCARCNGEKGSEL